MNLRKLACACCSAVFMLGLASCDDGNKDKVDGGPVVGLDAGKKPDTGIIEVKPDTGVDPGDTGVPAGEDASAPGPDAACVPNCPTGAECGSDGCGGTCGTGCTAPAVCVTNKCETGCRASCADKECGEDTCTPPGSCGTCGTGTTCVAGKCESECWKTACTGKECGNSGCTEKPSCGTCPSGKTCTEATGKCEERKCATACKEDEYCDIDQVTPVCLKICNPPDGCLDVEICEPDSANPHTGTCKPPTCNGEQCKTGQVCVDFAMSATDPEDLHCSCFFAYGDEPDTCAELGLVCGMDTTSIETIAPSECKKPGEFEDCIQTVGCETPADGGTLLCKKDIYSGPPLCLRSCVTLGKTDPSKCSDPTTYCNSRVGNLCMFNYCVYPDDLDCTANPTTCAAERAKLLKPCSAGGKNDGTCEAYVFSSGEEVGICVQGGSSTTTCDPDATRKAGVAVSPDMCKVGSTCLPIQPDDANPKKTKGLCQTVCNAATAPGALPQLGCTAATDFCYDYSGAPDSVTLTRFGICKQKCNIYGSDTCPDDLLLNKQICYPNSTFDGQGYCRAAKPNAPTAYGAACSYTDDKRTPCGDRLFCVTPDDSDDGFCYGFCKTSECSDSNAFCNQCVGSYCCKPNCAGRCNGEEDGCGGTCGCEAGKKCNTMASPNVCETCVGSCVGKCSGEDDGCGAKCNCEAGKKCDTTPAIDVCVACTRECVGKCSGEDDGCGGKCNCEVGQKCDTGADPDVCISCTRECSGKCSGEDDGCGGKCNCEGTDRCNTASDPDVCVTCTPTCAPGKCGMDDGCGGKCGCTGAGEWCSVGGDCKTSCLAKTDCPASKPVCDLVAPTGDAAVQPGTCICKPDCMNKHCGDDGCGGSCGACAATDKCLTPAVGSTLVCGNIDTVPTTMNLCQTK